MWRRILPILLAGVPMHGQSEQALRQFFEGKTVTVKMDMPATKDGVDIQYGQSPPIDYKSYSTRIKNKGVSIRQGDSVMVTTLRVKDKDIEFQLGGGGYGTIGDQTAYVYMPTISRSKRERDLEDRLKTEKDSRTRDQLSRELSNLSRARQRENARNRVGKNRLEEIKRLEIQEKALLAGSRFNLWFNKGYLKESVPTPGDVMRLLDEYVDFGGIAARPRTQLGIQERPPARRSDGLNGLKRGLSAGELHRLLGSPVKTRDSKQGNLVNRVEVFDTGDQSVEVTLVEGVVVKYSVSSK